MHPGAIKSAVTSWDYYHANAARHHAYVVPVILRRLVSLATGARVLDLGCGSGYLCGKLIEQGFRVTGVDASESGVAKARQVFPQGRFETASVTDAALPQRLGERFDAIVSMETIEHLYSPALFLRNCRDLLGPGGILVISTPYHGYIKLLVLALIGRMDRHLQPYQEGGHIKFWSKATLSRSVSNHGFDVTGFIGCGRVPLLWKSMVITGVRRQD